MSTWIALCIAAGIVVGKLGHDLKATIAVAAIIVGLLLGSALALVL